MAPLLQVYDMPRALNFYCDVLGLQRVSANAEGNDVDWVLLRGEGFEVMLNTAYEKDTRPSSEDARRREYHSDTILFFGHPDIDAAYDILKGKGVQLAPPQITGYGWKSISFSDPDGYSICIHWPMDE